MIRKYYAISPALILSLLISAACVAAPGMMVHHNTQMVAYDAKDRKWYSVEYARTHGMHDRGGDKLVIVPMSSLPKDAKMSHAMMRYNLAKAHH